MQTIKIMAFFLLGSISVTSFSDLVTEEQLEGSLCEDLRQGHYDYLEETNGWTTFMGNDSCKPRFTTEKLSDICHISNYSDAAFTVKMNLNTKYCVDYHPSYDGMYLRKKETASIECLFTSMYEWNCAYNYIFQENGMFSPWDGPDLPFLERVWPSTSIESQQRLLNTVMETIIEHDL